MSRPRAFVEAPAGLAAVSLYLHGGKYCRPPISRMGSKAGFSEVIAAALGLRGGIGADHFVWCESDPDVRALLRAYPDADMLRRIADIIRGWKDEEPRALWERLRVERKARGPAVDDEGAAGWLVSAFQAYKQGEPDSGFCATAGGGWPDDPRDSATVGDRCHRLAEYAIAGQWAYRRGVPESGFNAGLLEDREPTETGGNGAKARTCEQEAGLWTPAARASRWPPVAVLPTLPDAATLSALLGTPGDLEGVVVYGDADYRDTTGYADTCREMMPGLARGWSDAGAVVCLSEAEPYPELPTWHATEISAGRRGQKRTFSKQQAEWLTMNREPAHRVAVQVSMFGGTR